MKEWTDDEIRQALMKYFEAGSDGMKIVIPVHLAEMICWEMRRDFQKRIKELREMLQARGEALGLGRDI